MSRRFREEIFFKNKNGKIIVLEDVVYGGVSYLLFDAKGDYVKDLPVPFRVKDYL